MFCPNCGNEVKDGVPFCGNCGAKVLETPAQKAAPEPQPVPPVQPTPQPVVVTASQMTEDMLPAKYRPLGAWAYFGYSLLFAIPIVGFIFLIVFSCNGNNINRRNFARSYWCVLIILAIIAIIILILAATGVAFNGIYQKYA